MAKKSDKELLNKSVGLHPHTCAQCGKEFECRAEHVYKLPTTKQDHFRWFCTYSCIQKYRNEANIEKKRPTAKEKLVLEMLDRHAMIKDIVETLHVSKDTIYKIRDKWRQSA